MFKSHFIPTLKFYFYPLEKLLDWDDRHIRRPLQHIYLKPRIRKWQTWIFLKFCIEVHFHVLHRTVQLKNIDPKGCLGAISDWKTWNSVPVSMNGNGIAIKIVRFSNLNAHALFIASQIFFQNLIFYATASVD